MAMERDSLRSEGQLLQAMIAHWVHEDQLYWSQVRHALTVQLAIFIPWYQLKHRTEGIILCIIAIFISIILFFLAQTIRKNRDVNLEKIKLLSNYVIGPCLDSHFIMGSGHVFNFTMHRLSKEDNLPKADMGFIFQSFIFGLFILIDLTLIFYGAMTVDFKFPVQPYLPGVN